MLQLPVVNLNEILQIKSIHIYGDSTFKIDRFYICEKITSPRVTPKPPHRLKMKHDVELLAMKINVNFTVVGKYL